jgi:hypothetical protein
MGAENQPHVLAPPASPAPPPHPKITPADVDLPKAPSPLPTNRVTSSPQLSSQGSRFLEFDTLRPVPPREIPPSLMSGKVNTSESRLGVVPEAINLVEAEEDEEMPSIDMGSDSD